MDNGEKCICQENDWYNAFGDQCTALQMGMRLTVQDSKYVGGTRFYEFVEVPKNWFMADGFKPLRSLN
jgi:hypothetical protein